MRSSSCERICDLPEDMLVRILLHVPTKDAVTTSILSKRWRYVWTMLPRLVFQNEGSKCLGRLIDKSLQLHKAPKLLHLIVELSQRCRVDHNVHVKKWIEKAVNQGVRLIDFKLLWKAKPTRFPKSLYKCNTLFSLTLSNKIRVDVPSEASLPTLQYLELVKVFYKDQRSLARLLSASPVLKQLVLERRNDQDDNMGNFTLKVPSLIDLSYKSSWNDEEDIRSLVIDCPALTDFTFVTVQDSCLIQNNMPCLDEAFIILEYQTNEKFLRSFSSAKRLCLCLYLTKSMVASTIKFSRLLEFYFCSESRIDWLEPLTCLLQNFPILKTLVISSPEACLPSSWNLPRTIPGCLSSHLELFRWNKYGGREDEKQLVRYILANSKCLKTLEISFMETCNLNLEECRKELESMSKTSASSPILYFPTEPNYDF